MLFAVTSLILDFVPRERVAWSGTFLCGGVFEEGYIPPRVAMNFALLVAGGTPSNNVPS